MSINSNPQATQSNVIERAWRFLTEPHPSVIEIGERRRAQLLAALSLILVVAFALAVFSHPKTFGVFFYFLGITLITYISSRTKFYDVGAYFFSFGLTAAAYIDIYTGNANSIETSITSIVPISLILASAVLSQRGFILLTICTIAATGSVQSYADPKFLQDAMFNFPRTVGITSFIGLLLLGITAFRTGVENARLRDVQAMNQELENMATRLEERVDERTQDLQKVNEQVTHRAAQFQAITSLSETIAQVQDLNEILPAATQLISEAFGFYHVGIFLLDDAHEYAVLQAANSEGGQRMLQRNHRLKLGVGVVGFAAQMGTPRIALDVGADAVFFDNPDLPQTRSEVALPMKSRGEIIGILDVQSTQAGAFTSEDLQTLTTLANQVAISLENTKLLAETRAALLQVQEVYDEFTRAEWSRTVSRAEQPGFRYHGGRIEMIERAIREPEVVEAVQKGAIVTANNHDAGERRKTMAVPVKVRGETIGIIHVEAREGSNDWAESDISLVAAVAERAAFAMENARLFQDARRRAAKEQTISEATARISSAINIENILHSTAEELERVLGGSEVLIRFQSKEQS
jgi:GAF domain-containing protein